MYLRTTAIHSRRLAGSCFRPRCGTRVSAKRTSPFAYLMLEHIFHTKSCLCWFRLQLMFAGARAWVYKANIINTRLTVKRARKSNHGRNSDQYNQRRKQSTQSNRNEIVLLTTIEKNHDESARKKRIYIYNARKSTIKRSKKTNVKNKRIIVLIVSISCPARTENKITIKHTAMKHIETSTMIKWSLLMKNEKLSRKFNKCHNDGTNLWERTDSIFIFMIFLITKEMLKKRFKKAENDSKTPKQCQSKCTTMKFLINEIIYEAYEPKNTKYEFKIWNSRWTQYKMQKTSLFGKFNEPHEQEQKRTIKMNGNITETMKKHKGRCVDAPEEKTSAWATQFRGLSHHFFWPTTSLFLT